MIVRTASRETSRANIYSLSCEFLPVNIVGFGADHSRSLKVLKVPEDHYLWYQKGLLVSYFFLYDTLADYNYRRPSWRAYSPRRQVQERAARRSLRISDKRTSKLRGRQVRPPELLRKSGATRRWTRLEKTAQCECQPKKYPSRPSLTPDRCYDEMSEADEKRGRLIFDESIAGCGKREYISSASTVLHC